MTPTSQTRRTPVPKAAPELPTLAPDSIALLLGEIKGQLRELIHQLNTVSAKQDGLATRITALETAAAENKGRDGVLAALLRSPGLHWLLGAGVTAWLFLSGKAHP